MGIPAVLIATEGFTDACKGMAKLSGLPGIQWALVPHPIGSLPEDELRKRARTAASQVVGIVTGR